MNSTLIKRLLAATLVLGLAAPALAQDPQTPVLDKREQNQKERIKNGVDDGSLTRKETEKLVDGQVKLRADEAAAKSDGKVTPKERARLQHEANKQSRKIAKQKHDKQNR